MGLPSRKQRLSLSIGRLGTSTTPKYGSTTTADHRYRADIRDFGQYQNSNGLEDAGKPSATCAGSQRAANISGSARQGRIRTRCRLRPAGVRRSKFKIRLVRFERRPPRATTQNQSLTRNAELGAKGLDVRHGCAPYASLPLSANQFNYSQGGPRSDRSRPPTNPAATIYDVALATPLGPYRRLTERRQSRPRRPSPRVPAPLLWD